MKTFWIILGIVAAIGAAVVLYFVFRKSGANGGVNGGDDPPADPTPAQLEEKKRVKFMKDCKTAGLSEVFCDQAWNRSDKQTLFSDFASTGYGIPGGGACVPFTKKQYNSALNACWKKCLYLGLIPGGFLQAQCFEKCKKTIPPIISCP